MNPQNEEQAPSYKTMLKKYLNSLSKEKCKDCCYVANLLVPGSIPESDEDEFEEEEDEFEEENESEYEEDEFEEENESEDEEDDEEPEEDKYE